MNHTRQFIFQDAIQAASRDLYRVAEETDKKTRSRILAILTQLARDTYAIWKMKKVTR